MDNSMNKLLEQFLKSGNFAEKNNAFKFLMTLSESPDFRNPDWHKICRDMGSIYKDPAPIYSGPVFTPDPIPRSSMGADDVFVFGSNTEGKHGGGAAREAVDYYEAEYGNPKGMQGRSYAIVTKDLKVGVKSVSIDDIERDVDEFLEYAFNTQNKKFWMTKIGCGLGGFEIQDIAPVFANKVIPYNVILPIEFAMPKFWMEYTYSPSKNKMYRFTDGYLFVLDLDLMSISPLKMNQSHLPDDIRVANAQDWKDAVEQITLNALK